MILKRTHANRVIAAGILIMLITWSMTSVADMFMGNPEEIKTALLEPRLREAAKWLAIVIIVIGVVGYFLQIERKQQSLIDECDGLLDLINELKHDTRTLKTIKGLLPSCPTCDSIRDERGTWYELKKYLEKYPDAVFVEGCCPGCTRKKES